jgi:hypothetical protein
MENMFDQPIQPQPIPETSGGLAGTVVTLIMLAGGGWLLYDKFMNDDWIWNRLFKGKQTMSSDGRFNWCG